MLSKNQIKYINSLKINKFRNEHRQFIAEGNKLVKEMIQCRMQVAELFATETWVNENKDLEEAYRIQHVTEDELKKISNLNTSGSVLALIDIPSYSLPEEISDLLIIILDGVSDPGNFGTIIRTCDWFGIDNIYCSESTVDVYNPKVVQSTMGSIARVRVHYSGMESFLKNLPSVYNIYGTFMDGENIFKSSFPGPTVIVFGNESKGISAELIPYIARKLCIPYTGITDNRPESLNVAVSHAIITAEYFRRKATT